MKRITTNLRNLKQIWQKQDFLNLNDRFVDVHDVILCAFLYLKHSIKNLKEKVSLSLVITSFIYPKNQNRF